MNPLFFVGVFHLSELRTRDWLGTGFDSDRERLELIHSGGITSSRIGAHLGELKERFQPTVVVDMLCALRRLSISERARQRSSDFRRRKIGWASDARD